MDDPGVEDEGRARVCRAAQHGRARRAGTGAGAVSRVVAGVSIENRRAAAPERAGTRASPRQGRLDSARVPFERAVVDGGVRRPGRGRRSLSRPCPPQPDRSGIPAKRSSQHLEREESEKRLRFFKPAVVAYVRSPGSCAAHRRRSRENCGGTQQREVETSSIEPRPPNGMPIGERSVRKLPNSLRTAN